MSSLSDFATSALDALFRSALPEPSGEHADIVQSAFAADVDVSFNHAKISFPELKEEFSKRFGAAAGVEIEWKDVFEDEVSPSRPSIEGAFKFLTWLAFRNMASLVDTL